nr:MAG TPA: hypothetical protein [Caudoviricetes sp.]
MTKLEVVTQNEQKSYMRKIKVASGFKIDLSKIIDCINNLFPETTVTIKETKQESPFHMLNDHVFNHEIQIVIDQPVSGYKVELLNMLLSHHKLYEDFDIVFDPDRLEEQDTETTDTFTKQYLLLNPIEGTELIAVKLIFPIYSLKSNKQLFQKEYIDKVCKHQTVTFTTCNDTATLLTKVKDLFDKYLEMYNTIGVYKDLDRFFKTTPSYLLDVIDAKANSISSFHIALKHHCMYRAELDRHSVKTYTSYFTKLTKEYPNLNVYVFTSMKSIRSYVEDMYYFFGTEEDKEEVLKFLEDNNRMELILPIEEDPRLDYVLKSTHSDEEGKPVDRIRITCFNQQTNLSRLMKELDNEVCDYLKKRN